MLEILTRICEGRGKPEDPALIRKLAAGMETSCLCALGQLTPGPVMAALRYFEDEFTAHIEDKRCPAGSCKDLVPSRCVNACPAGVDVPAFVSLTAEGRYAEALAIHRENNPFAMVCARVCPAYCEQRCRRGDIDQPVAVRAIKRLMADHEADVPWTPEKTGPSRAEKVAVVGAGPAGLTAALRLAQNGYPVTVLEALPVPGGMLAVGIPEYRLPREALNQEIENIRRAGVEIRCNQRLGMDFTLDSLLTADGYRAVVLAIGAHRSLRLGIAGEDIKGVYPGVEFLRDTALGNPPALNGKSVAVIGGGNVAIDAARTAVRLGASEVHVVYRRTRPDMPAYVEEIEAAEQEGVILHFLAAPVEILGKKEVVGIEIQNQELSDFDSSGRRRPVPVAGGLFTLAVDAVIQAVGQRTETDWAGALGPEINRDSTVRVGKDLSTSRPGVFAAGDAASGPASVVEAVDQGNRVAAVVDRYLQTGQIEKIDFPLEVHGPALSWNMEAYGEAARIHPVHLPVAEAKSSFREVELLPEENAVREECKRCLRCDLEYLEHQQRKQSTEPIKAAAAAAAS